MYLGMYVHGVLLSVKQSRPKCDAGFVDMYNMLKGIGFTIDTFTPSMMRLRCTNNTACGFNPCAVLSVQTDVPEIPNEYKRPNTK